MSESTGTVLTAQELRQQTADEQKYQAKLEVIREVVARRGMMPTEEAKQLAECVNAAFDDITL